MTNSQHAHDVPDVTLGPLRTESASYLFLDFDGVTHPEKADCDELFVRDELLNQWLQANPDVQVVISSSWREVHSLSELRDFFPCEMASRIMGATPTNILKVKRRFDGRTPRDRQAEIEHWLRAHGKEGCAWVALDDQAWRFRVGCKSLVVCDGKIGLTRENLAQARAILDAWRPAPPRKKRHPAPPRKKRQRAAP